jgi:hypothetical protein
MHNFLYKYTSMIDACLKNQKKKKVRPFLHFQISCAVRALDSSLGDALFAVGAFLGV